MQGFSKAPVELDGVKHEPIWPYGRAWLTIVNAVQAAVMVAIAQLVEHRVVVAGVAGSSPVSHPSQFPGTVHMAPGNFLWVRLAASTGVTAYACGGCGG